MIISTNDDGKVYFLGNLNVSMSEETDTDRAVSSLIGNILLVAIVVILGSIIAIIGLGIVGQFGTPTADAAFRFEQSSAGIVLRPTAISTDVTVKLNGDDIARISDDEAGKPVLIPTAPGDEITVVSQDGQRAVLLREQVDSRDQLGDFISYYSFDKGDDPLVLADQSGNGNDGQLRSESGDPADTGPQWGGCGLQFDGTNDRVEIEDISAPVDVTEFTIVVEYTQTGNTGSVNQLVEHRFQDGSEWFLETSSGPYSLDFAAEYPNEVINAEAVSPDTRHVAVGTYNGSNFELYVDGKQVAEGTHAEPVEMGDMTLGRDFEGTIQHLEGELCELRLYYTAFEDEDIERITNAVGS